MRVFAHPPPLLSAQALTLYTRDADGSVKAVIAAKAGGLDLTVLPIAQYTGSADASQVRIAAIASPKPRRRNPERRGDARKVSGETLSAGEKDRGGGIACRMLFFFFVFSFAISKPSRRLTRHALVPLRSLLAIPSTNVSLFPLNNEPCFTKKRRPPS